MVIGYLPKKNECFQTKLFQLVTQEVQGAAYVLLLQTQVFVSKYRQGIKEDIHCLT